MGAFQVKKTFFKLSIFLISAITLSQLSGCASSITGYSKGDFIKEEKTGHVEYLDSQTVLTRKSNTAVKVENVERYGEVSVNYYEKKEHIDARRPSLNPFSLLTYTVYRGIIGPLYLICGAFGNGKMLWHGFDLLLLPIPDCSESGPFSSQSDNGNKMLCVESNYSKVVDGEYESETHHTNITDKRVPVTYGAECRAIELTSDAATLRFASGESAQANLLMRTWLVRLVVHDRTLPLGTPLRLPKCLHRWLIQLLPVQSRPAGHHPHRPIKPLPDLHLTQTSGLRKLQHPSMPLHAAILADDPRFLQAQHVL